jgi:hypothetical protein
VRAPKQRCDNCPARNSRVRRYTIPPLRGNSTEHKLLCRECAEILAQILSEEASRNAPANRARAAEPPEAA